ncbi:alpha/beta hydrolase [Halobacteriovorax sp. GB3]|uniref:alpha/beta fold hydrolase n=1 Tax=Halobacteriovorax sp. GB3 TaxID=2719615 RepID=UPI002360ABA4|nr:alpha/beta hydrolase [Halobacteriovorax sp. GB3]MDD0852956.1 alpha/beta hydrolase [Halobacteriovorax sp. GB3]
MTIINGLEFERIGKGDPVLCLSGFGCSNWNFDLLKNLLAENVELVLLNNRGMGNSEQIPKGHRIDDMANESVALMKELGFEKFHVFGISMGGFIAQKIALNHSECVLSLTLACTLSGGEDFPSIQKLTEESVRKGREFADDVRERMICSMTIHPELLGSEIFDHIVNLRVSNVQDVEEVVKQQKAVDIFLDEVLPLETIKSPTLIMTGREDRFVCPKASEVFHKKIKTSQLKYIEKADHHFFLERSAQSAKAFLSFIQENNR